MTVRAAAGEPLPRTADIILEGRRTLSIATRSIPGQAAWLVTWPRPLADVLDGWSSIAIRDPVTGVTSAEVEVHFGTSDARLDLRDHEGRWLSVNKWGHLAPAFDGLDEVHRVELQEQLLDGVQGLLRDLEELGVDAFIVYGTLLGQTRDGDLIPHDDDADLGYLSRCAHPADVVRENYRLAVDLEARGYEVTRHSGGHLQICSTGSDGGGEHHIDVFTAFETGGVTYLAFQVGDADLCLRDTRLVEMRGRRLPAPVQAHELLTATYGAGWRTPDPSFTFQTPDSVRSRLMTWMGEFNMARDHWQDFYDGDRARLVPTEPSSFATWVTGFMPSGVPVLDVGTGTGRDARLFAGHGRVVLAIDASAAAVARGRRTAETEGWSAEFAQVNLADLVDVGRLIRSTDFTVGWHLYARFLVHAIDDAARENLWLLTREVVRHGGLGWFEFRTTQDAGQEHAFGEHYRRYLESDQVVAELEQHGLSVHARHEGRGLAPYGDEDPWVARLCVGLPR